MDCSKKGLTSNERFDSASIAEPSRAEPSRAEPSRAMPAGEHRCTGYPAPGRRGHLNPPRPVNRAPLTYWPEVFNAEFLSGRRRTTWSTVLRSIALLDGNSGMAPSYTSRDRRCAPLLVV